MEIIITTRYMVTNLSLNQNRKVGLKGIVIPSHPKDHSEGGCDSSKSSKEIIEAAVVFQLENIAQIL
jgi:hypothetical protein